MKKTGLIKFRHYFDWFNKNRGKVYFDFSPFLLFRNFQFESERT